MKGRILRLTILLLFLGAALAEELYWVPEALMTRYPGALQIKSGSDYVTYIDGLGWLPDGPNIPPVTVGNRVYLPAALLEAFSVRLPRLEGVRIRDEESIRLVLDISNLPAGPSPDAVGSEGALEDQGVFSLDLPDLLVRQGLLERFIESESVDIVFDTSAPRPRVLISGTAFSYQSFALRDPSRVVIDLNPLSFAAVREVTRPLHPGVTYRRFAAPTTSGSTGVHLVEIAPDAGHLRVVGQSHGTRPLSQLASGSLAAINAGYFDTRSAQAIGLLKVDQATLSFPFPGRPSSVPYLGRASIGFADGLAIIDRVRAEVTLRLDGRDYTIESVNGTGASVVHTIGGQVVGRPEQRALVVANGLVFNNGFGPQTVPDNGFVLIYEPHIDYFAHIRPGTPASLLSYLNPVEFNSVRYAVEGGPLLIKDGVVNYNPTAENFLGDIHTRRTDRTAIGVRPDGTVLLVTADSMATPDLIPLFQSLGATSAMALDGGGSTTMYVAGEVMNRRFQRPITSAIVFVPY